MSKIQYFHLSNDEKFLDYVIENCEAIAPCEGIYAVKSNKQKFQYVKSTVTTRVASVEDALELLKSNADIKYVYIHFLMDWSIDFVLKLPANLKVVWVFWGADGYALPRLRKYNYLSATRKFVKSLDPGKHTIFHEIYRSLFRTESKLRKAIKRLDYCATWVEQDFDLIKPYNEKIKFIMFSNNSVEQLLGDVLDFKVNQNTNKSQVFIGNSGHPTNNHLEVFELFKTQPKYELVLPLSYGNPVYIERLNNIGYQWFGERYKPLTSFMDKDQYHQLMLGSDCIVMNHTRQQGANNTLVALWCARPVFMNSVSTLYQTYKNWGVTVFDIDDLPKFLSTGVIDADLSANKGILKEKLGTDAVLNYYKAFLFKENTTV